MIAGRFPLNLRYSFADDTGLLELGVKFNDSLLVQSK